VKEFSTKKYGKVASLYITPYLYGRQSADKQYGIRKEDGNFIIGDSTLTVDKGSNIKIKGREYRGTSELWELLIRQNVDKKITGDDLKTYKNILELTNAHLEGYEPGGGFQISRGSKYREVISKLHNPGVSVSNAHCDSSG
jgi:hypothetical protein